MFSGLALVRAAQEATAYVLHRTVGEVSAQDIGRMIEESSTVHLQALHRTSGEPAGAQDPSTANGEPPAQDPSTTTAEKPSAEASSETDDEEDDSAESSSETDDEEDEEPSAQASMAGVLYDVHEAFEEFHRRADTMTVSVSQLRLEIHRASRVRRNYNQEMINTLNNYFNDIRRCEEWKQ